MKATISRADMPSSLIVHLMRYFERRASIFPADSFFDRSFGPKQTMHVIGLMMQRQNWMGPRG